MEQVSAFAAYQSAAPKKAKKKKSSSVEKQHNHSSPTVATKGPPQKKRKNEAVTKNSNLPKENLSSNVSNNTASTSGIPSKNTKSSDPQKSKNVSAHQNGGYAEDLNLSSVQNGRDAFSYILSGIDVQEFMASHWEKSPLFIQRRNEGHYNLLNVSTNSIDEMLRSNLIEFTKNVDVTSYENGVRQTHNPDGRAMSSTVWDFYNSGCSIRLINPQTYISDLHRFSATMQEYFHCLVGANVYLTPANSQGFAPHYDDIEAFVLQIEGEKEWSLYAPRTENETLPRESSGNFSQEEIGEPVFTKILKPGDLLYFPRGWIHQAKTVPNHHSLHVTLSVYQKTSFADLFEELVKQTVKNAIESNVAYRKGLPLDIWNHFGHTYSEYQSGNRRKQLSNVMSNLFKDLVKYVDFDGAVDQLAIKYQHDALPPVLNAAEKARTTFGTKPKVHDSGMIEMPEIAEATEIRLVRANIARLTLVDGVSQLYYYADNSKEYHGNDLNFIEVEEATVQIIKKLIQLYPKYIKIQDISDDIEDSMAVVHSLWERGLLMTKKPME